MASAPIISGGGASIRSGALAPVSGSTRSSILSPVLRDIISLADWGADRTGSTDVATYLNEAFAEAQAIALTGYGATKGAKVVVPAGKYLIGSKIVIPENCALWGEGFGATTFLTASSFPDNCVFEPAAIDQSQEFMGLYNFRLYGQTSGGTPTNNQANGGTATTVQTTIAGSSTVGSYNIVAAGDLSGYARSGTITVGTKRVTYQSITLGTLTTQTFNKCYTISNDIGVIINSGDAIAPVTTDNLRGIHMLGMANPSYLRDLWIQYFTGETILLGGLNSCKIQAVEGTNSNRDSILYLSTRASNFMSEINALYSGVSDVGNTFAGLHVLGQNGTHSFEGLLSIDGLYSEQTAHDQIGLWLQNIPSVDAKNINLEGGTNSGGTSYATQVGIQIDAGISSPLTQDSTHAANISLRNIACGQIGRILLKDNVRGYSSVANATTQGTAMTRYDTEDTNPRLKGTPTYSASITPDCTQGEWQTITVTNTTAFTINAPTTPPGSLQTAELIIEVLNSSGGSMGAITWNAAFVFAGLTWTNPASTKKRYARFKWNGAAWVCQTIASADY